MLCGRLKARTDRLKSVIFTSPVTGCSHAPSPAESHTSKRTHFLPVRVEGNAEGLGAEGLGISQLDDLAIDLRAVAPDELGKFEREGVFDAGGVNALRARAFNAPIVKENFARGAEEIARANPFDDRRPALVVRRHLVELEVIDSQQRIGVVARALSYRCRLRRA